MHIVCLDDVHAIAQSASGRCDTAEGDRAINALMLGAWRLRTFSHLEKALRKRLRPPGPRCHRHCRLVQQQQQQPLLKGAGGSLAAAAAVNAAAAALVEELRERTAGHE